MAEIFKNGKTLKEYWEPGFLNPSLLLLDQYGSGRWHWWNKVLEDNEVPKTVIPHVDWAAGNNEFQKVVGLLDECVVYTRLDSFLDFLLYGFGNIKSDSWMSEPYAEILGWERRLHEAFPTMVTKPAVYLTQFIENQMSRGSKKGTGFFATPIHVCEFMAQITFMDNDDITKRVVDPCMGTGNLLLAASNYSINLYGQDINSTVIKGALIQGQMYAPWLVHPLPCLAAGTKLQEEQEGIKIPLPAPPQRRRAKKTAS